MTGEITLRGLVLPVGGIKEKVIAAYRSGFRKVLIPYQNKKDLRNLPGHVREGLDIIPVKVGHLLVMTTKPLEVRLTVA